MRTHKNHKKIYIGICTGMIVLTIIVMILSFVFSLIGINGSLTSINNGLLESSIVTVNNIFSIDGLKYILNNTLNNYKSFEPLIILILSVISAGILEKSGFLSHVLTKFNKLKLPIILIITILVSMILNFFGEYSFVVLLPFVVVIYKILGKNPIIGIIATFLASTFGFGVGVALNNDILNISALTQTYATLDVDPSYKYNLFSSIYIAIFFLLLLLFFLTYYMNEKVVSKLKKTYNSEITEIKHSKKGLVFSFITIFLLLAASIILFFPGFGIMNSNDKTLNTLFDSNSIFKNGMIYIMLLMSSLVGVLYGKISKNFKNDMEANLNFSGDFENFGIIFLIIFLGVQLNGILEYTNLGTILLSNATNLISILGFSGLILVVFFILVNVVLSFVVPSFITKWQIMSPIIVPLFMRANMTPEFCQFMYLISNSIGKILSPFNIYFLIMIGYLSKYYDESLDVTFKGIFKLLLPTVLIISGIMILAIILWYVSGLPIGLSGFLTL